MNSSQYRKLPRHYNPQDTYLLELSQSEFQMLEYLLPKGYSVALQPKLKINPPSQQAKSRQDENSFYNNQYSSMMQNQSSSNHPNKNNLSSSGKQMSKSLPKAQPQKKGKQQIPESVKPCFQILQKLKKNQFSWPFLQPVNAIELGIPEYYEIIQQPMDLSTVQKKYKSFAYKTPQQFYRDINLMIKNSFIFNQANEEFLKLTADFQKFFFKIAGNQAKPLVDKKLQKQREKQRERLQKERIKEEKIRQKMLEKQKQKQRKMLLQQQQQAELALKQAKKKKKFIPKDLLQAQNICIQQKQQLANNIHILPKQHLRGIKQIVFTDSSSRLQQAQNNYQSLTVNQHQFDIQKIGYKKIRQLQKYVRIKLMQIENNKFTIQSQDKKEQIDLDELESEWTQQFVD